MLKQLARASLRNRGLLIGRNVSLRRSGFCTYAPDASQPLGTEHDVPAGFDEENLKFIVCPVTKKPLRYDSEKNVLISDELGKAFPILNGIPDLLPNSAKPIDEVVAES
ncbi:hypothetical protein HPB48_009029 [Haemaphysalis longicornis]|uniref:Protein preY, mitochondrial n=1 Tax=Haemaphysalis longicornis TaxID=44386 RepID=A0A9J6H3S6_HAELO|nr:hypothetical protein HPB48_009029 [Haemaphysalis longicornis]